MDSLGHAPNAAASGRTYGAARWGARMASAHAAAMSGLLRSSSLSQSVADTRNMPLFQ